MSNSKYYKRLSGKVDLHSIDGLRDVYVPNNTNTAAFYRWIIGNMRELWATLANIDPANTGYYSLRASGGTEVSVEAGSTVNLLDALYAGATTDVSNLPTANATALTQTRSGDTYLRTVNAPLKSWYTLRADIEVIPDDYITNVQVQAHWGDTEAGGLTYTDQFEESVDFHRPLHTSETSRFTVDVPNVVTEAPGVLNRENKVGLELTAADPCTVRIHRLDLYIHA